MKVVVLAGGYGTRLAEETDMRPKALIEIGGRPILWHILKHYAHHGFREFYLALGYKADAIKRFFLDLDTLGGSLTVDLANGTVTRHERKREEWVVHLIDTGLDTNTGGRVGRLRRFLDREPFMLTYCDGVSDVDLARLADFHRKSGRIATVTAVRPPSRFGGLVIEGDQVTDFTEKPQIGEGWINGGFMVFEPGIFDYCEGDHVSLEADMLERVAEDGQLAAFRHERFWQCMDTLRDRRLLDRLWDAGAPPWKIWP